MYIFSVGKEVKWFTNYDLCSIETPVKVDILEQLLIESNYDAEKSSYLIEGFTNGFELMFEGDRKVKRLAPNLPFIEGVGDKFELWNKVMTEVEAKRYAGPYESPPFKYFIQSPLGLVPKDKGKKTRLIFHLSYPRKGAYSSINSEIPYEFCKVKYPSFDNAVKLCLEAGKNCHAAKSDMARAFRNVPLAVKEFAILLMKAEHPLTGKTFFFVEKCLPFGSSISCKIFQDFSDAVAHIVRTRTRRNLVNYLDDYFFAALFKMWCDWQVQQFLNVCKEINFPVSLEKMEWGSTILTFLGLILNTVTQTVSIPEDKIVKAREQLLFFLNRKNRKTTVLRAQQLCGLLNFICKCVIPGRAFVTRLYSLAGNSSMKPYHHVRITKEHRLDIMVWDMFLQQPNVFCRPFMDYKCIDADEVNMYSDASGNFRLGYGALCNQDWLIGQWDPIFMEKNHPSIEFLELYALTAGVLCWIRRFRNRKIYLFCDNDSVKNMINNSSSKCKNCMILIRLITIESLIHNVKVFAKHVKTEDNGITDALSRLQMKRFRRLAPNMKKYPTPIPSELIPMEKVWFH